jgi:hypothetical protein
MIDRGCTDVCMPVCRSVETFRRVPMRSCSSRWRDALSGRKTYVAFFGEFGRTTRGIPSRMVFAAVCGSGNLKRISSTIRRNRATASLSDGDSLRIRSRQSSTFCAVMVLWRLLRYPFACKSLATRRAASFRRTPLSIKSSMHAAAHAIKPSLTSESRGRWLIFWGPVEVQPYRDRGRGARRLADVEEEAVWDHSRRRSS